MLSNFDIEICACFFLCVRKEYHLRREINLCDNNPHALQIVDIIVNVYLK